MSVFRYMEYAVGSPANRGRFASPKEIINKPFRKENRFKEYWRGMFAYPSPNPTEEDAMFGNFYLESDEEDFHTNRSCILEAVDYLVQNYQIPYSYFEFFATNRSLWVTLPAKAFGCYGTKKLHMVYRLMAEEIQEHLKGKRFKKGLDLSIYKWNGLIHSLGSYLPSSEAWVSKFSLSDLEDTVSMDMIRKAKYDTGFTYSEVKEVAKAKTWFSQKKKQVFSIKKTISNPSSPLIHSSMKKLEEHGELNENRNLHIYSYALQLKDLGFSFSQAVEKIQNTFKNGYVHTKECLRTIKSAISGSKHYSPKAARQLLDQDLFENVEETSYSNTFIIPRQFVSLLHKEKAHYQVYKLLFKVLYSYQVLKTNYIHSLKGDKYKKDTIAYFEKLVKAGVLSYTLKQDEIITTLIPQPKSVYKSHMVIPNDFMQHPFFLKSKREFIVFTELWRAGFKTSEHKSVVYVALKLSNLAKNVRMNLTTVLKYVAILKKEKLYSRSFLFVSCCNKEFKEKQMDVILNARKQRMKAPIGKSCENKGETFTNRVSFNPFPLIIKCNYSP